MHIDKIIKREITGIIITTVLLLTIFIGVSFAAFFSIDEGEENVIKIGDIDVTFCSDVSCGEAYANYGQVIGMETVDGVSTPTAIYPYESSALALESNPYIFNIKNTGSLKVYFNAYLEEDKDFIPSGSYENYTSVTELYSNHVKVGISECDGGTINRDNVTEYRFGELVEGKIIDNVEMEVDSEKTYCLWTWLDEATPNDVQETYFVANLNFTAEYKPEVPWYDECEGSNNLNCKIVNAERSYADNVSSPNVKYSTGINFAEISSDTNGKGLYYTVDAKETEEGKRVYYYRGAVENNNVRFGGYCWRIVRTNEDGSVRLRYNGEYADETCPVTGTAVSINDTNYSFADSHQNNNYDEYVRDDGSGDSSIKGTIESWYTSSGLSNYADKIANVPYCADKTLPNVIIDSQDIRRTYYGAANRLYDFNDSSVFPKTGAQPIFKCNDETHKYTVSGDSWNGNGRLSHSIALLTADEIAYAGGIRTMADGSANNNTFYLYTGANYWAMSPNLWNESTGYMYITILGGSGALGQYSITSSLSTLPVISLKSDVVVSEGQGSYTNPYVVE